MAFYTFKWSTADADGASVVVRNAANEVVASGSIPDEVSTTNEAFVSYSVDLPAGDTYVASATLPDGRERTAAGTLDHTSPAALSATYARRGGMLRGGRAVFLGDSNTQGASDETNLRPRPNSYVQHVCDYTGQRLRLISNAGVGGEDTAQMLARFQADVVALAPDVVVVMGGTNDISARGWPATTSMDNLKAIYAAAAAAGIDVVACTIYPRTGLTTAVYDEAQKLNGFIRNYAARHDMPCLDFHSLFTDPSTGGWAVAGDTADGVHTSHVGAAKAGKFAADRLLPILPPQPPALATVDSAIAPSANLVKNGLMLRDSAGALFDWGSSTPRPTLIAGTNGLLGRWAEWNNPAAGLTMPQTITTGWAVGDELEFLCPYQIDSLGGSGANFSINVEFVGAGQFWQPVRQTTAPTPTGYLAIARAVGTVPVGTTSIKVYPSTSAGGPIFRIGQVTLANRTAQGIASRL